MINRCSDTAATTREAGFELVQTRDTGSILRVFEGVPVKLREGLDVEPFAVSIERRLRLLYAEVLSEPVPEPPSNSFAESKLPKRTPCERHGRPE